MKAVRFIGALVLVVSLMTSCGNNEDAVSDAGPTGRVVGVVQDADGQGLESDIGFDPDPYPMSDIGFTTDLRGRFNIIIPEGD